MKTYEIGAFLECFYRAITKAITTNKPVLVQLPDTKPDNTVDKLFIKADN